MEFQISEITEVETNVILLIISTGDSYNLVLSSLYQMPQNVSRGMRKWRIVFRILIIWCFATWRF